MYEVPRKYQKGGDVASTPSNGGGGDTLSDAAGTTEGWKSLYGPDNSFGTETETQATQRLHAPWKLPEGTDRQTGDYPSGKSPKLPNFSTQMMTTPGEVFRDPYAEGGEYQEGGEVGSSDVESTFEHCDVTGGKKPCFTFAKGGGGGGGNSGGGSGGGSNAGTSAGGDSGGSGYQRGGEVQPRREPTHVTHNRNNRRMIAHYAQRNLPLAAHLLQGLRRQHNGFRALAVAALAKSHGLRTATGRHELAHGHDAHAL